MDFKIGCQTLPYSELPLKRALEGIARAGFEYVCFGTTHEGQPVPAPEASDQDIAALGRLVADHGLTPIMCFFPSGGPSGDNGVDLCKRRLDQAKVLGIGHVLAWGPWEYESWPGKKFATAAWKQTTDQWFEAMAPVARHAEAVGVTAVLKPHTGVTAYGNVLRATIERIGSPNVQACYDGGNVHFYEGLDPALDIKDCAEYVKALCIKDHRGLRGNPEFPCPGEGEVDDRAMLEVLKPFGFDGPVVVERFEGPHKKAEMVPELIDGLAAQACAYLKRVKAELG